jgi:hypothetical protein
MSQMDKYQRAAQLWSLLVLAAQHQVLLSYSMIEHLTGIPRVAVGMMLGPITHYCQNQKLPWLTFIVVNEENGQPGEGPLPGARRTYGNTLDFHTMQSRVFVYDWFKHPAPKTDDFKRADSGNKLEKKSKKRSLPPR